MSKGKLGLSCQWTSILSQKRETFYQQDGDITDFMQKDGLKKTEMKGSKLYTEVTATFWKEMKKFHKRKRMGVRGRIETSMRKKFFSFDIHSCWISGFQTEHLGGQ